MAKLKRENFEVSPEQEAEINSLQALIDAPTRKDAILTAIHLTLHLASETRQGRQVFIGEPGCRDPQRLLMLGIEKPSSFSWMYLVAQAHPWKKQLYVKGRKLPAAAVWNSMHANKMTVSQAADDWDLPEAAINEIVSYCDSHQEFLKMEAEEELRRLNERGISLESPPAR
jgi:hypothetical protein